MTKRVLVLSSSTGSGHDMRARAFATWARQLYGDALEIRTEQIIENGSWLGQFGVWVYNTIHRYCPFLHNLYFFIVELFIFTHAGSVSFGGRYYRRLIADFRPHVIFSVHDSTNRGYFEDARKVLGETVRCVTYCGEFSGGYGYSRNWVNPAADLFIARTGIAREHAIRLGIERAKSAVFHKFLPPDAFEEELSPGEKAALRSQLGLDPERFTLFLATGGYGANHHRVFLRELVPLAAKIQVIVVCGRNPAVFDTVAGWAEQNPELKLYLEGYSTQMAQFLQISHAVVTRGGANTTMEALHFGCPLLYDSLGGLMPQERCTVRYFLDNGAARMIHKPADLARFVLEWADFGQAYREVRTNLSKLHFEEDPRQLIRQVLGEYAPKEQTP